MKSYVKSEKGYEKVTYEAKKIKSAYKKMKASKKHPTSINLSAETVSDLKSIASARGIPYQTLMRMLVLEGLEKLKKAS
jgi:predicted DNA binding CopG/RHH family protein